MATATGDAGGGAGETEDGDGGACGAASTLRASNE